MAMEHERMDERADSGHALGSDGFVKLPQLIPYDLIKGLRALLDDELDAPDASTRTTEFQKNTGGGQFSGYSNGIDLDASIIHELLELPALRAVLARACEEPLLVTKALGFAIEPGKQGLRWHFGFRSFNFIKPTDMGYTLWIPLDVIDVQRQHGGVAMVSEQVCSGRGESQLLGQLSHDAQGRPEVAAKIRAHFDGFANFRNIVLELHAVELSFGVGDALLFNRFVMHRSCEFRPGPMAQRRAFVLRFVPASASYEPELMAAQRALCAELGLHVHAQPAGAMFDDLAAGARLGDSSNRRVVKRV